MAIYNMYGGGRVVVNLANSISKKYESKQLIYDFERGEVIDSETGEVIEDHLIESTSGIRGVDYAEWDSKRHYEVLVEDKDRKLKSVVYCIGKRIGAPQWLCEDVIRFIKRATMAKTRIPGFKSTSFYREKFVLAVFYVLSLKRGLVGLAESIGKMKCGNSPCYTSRRRKDKEFHKYIVLALKAWSVLYRSNYINEVKNYIRYFGSIIREFNGGIDVIRVIAKALDLLKKLDKGIGGYKPKNLAVALLVKATSIVYDEDKANHVLRILIEKCGVSKLGIRSILKRLQINI